MDNFTKTQKNTALIIIVFVIGLFIYMFLHNLLGFYQTSSDPSKRVIFTNQSLTLYFNKEITNDDEILKDFKVDNSAFVAVNVEGSAIKITPISVYKPNNKYKITIPKIVSKNNKIINEHVISFSTKDKATDEEHAEQEDVEKFLFKKYPGLPSITDGSDPDYTVEYGFEEDRLTLFVDIQPYLPSDQRFIDGAMNKKIVETNNKFLKKLEELGLKKEDFYFIYTPDGVKDILDGKVPEYYDPYQY